MNYYERHIGDYAKDAGHLSMLEHGAYTILLDRYYSTEQGIPEGKAHRLCRARTDDEVQAVDVVLEEFFELVDGVWINSRAEEEILKARAKIVASQENGKKGGRPPKTVEETQQKPNPFDSETQQKPNPFDSETQIKAHQTPNTKHQTPEDQNQHPPTPSAKPVADKTESASPVGAAGGGSGFAEFWLAYPKKVGKGEAERKWKTLKPDAGAVLSAVKRQSASEQWRRDGGQYIPNPATWLHQRRWEDEPAQPPANSSSASADRASRYGGVDPFAGAI